MNVPFAPLLQIGREVRQLSSCLEQKNYTLRTFSVLPTACNVIVAVIFCFWKSTILDRPRSTRTALPLVIKGTLGNELGDITQVGTYF